MTCVSAPFALRVQRVQETLEVARVLTGVNARGLVADDVAGRVTTVGEAVLAGDDQVILAVDLLHLEQESVERAHRRACDAAAFAVVGTTVAWADEAIAGVLHGAAQVRAVVGDRRVGRLVTRVAGEL